MFVFELTAPLAPPMAYNGTTRQMVPQPFGGGPVTKRRGVSLVAGLTILLAVVLCLVGCKTEEERAELSAHRDEALAYYQEKYGVKDVRIEEEGTSGSYGLFGIQGDDRYYRMSDGYCVIYDADENSFADSQQANEISRAATDEVLKPRVEELGATEVEWPEIGLVENDAISEHVFTTFYDGGDIEEYLAEEHPQLSGMQIRVDGYEDGYWREIVESFVSGLAPYVDFGDTRIVVADISISEYLPEYEHLRELSVADTGVLGLCDVSRSGTCIWNIQHFVALAPGVMFVSTTPNLELEDGEIYFVEAETVEDLQATIDAAYEALPDKSSDNSGSSYVTRDKAHESRAVIRSDQPVYKLECSERVQELIDNRALYGYVRIDPEVAGNVGLWYHVDDVRYGYRMFLAAVPTDETTRGGDGYHTPWANNLYVLGTVEDNAWDKAGN